MRNCKRKFEVSIFQTTHKSQRILRKEVDHPGKTSAHLDLKNSKITAKTNQDKQFKKLLKYVLATKIKLKDKNLGQKNGNFLILNFNITPL